MNYINGLHGIRAIAVLFVIIEHWFPIQSSLRKFPFGEVGVDIFFVLSGFLITRILLEQKEKIAAGQLTLVDALKNFILKRTLRIFPIYYILVFFLFFTNGEAIKNGLFYYLTYTSNYFFYCTKDWHGMTAHLWSLAVEEQFYLFWPVILFCIYRKRILPLLFVCIIIGTIFPFFLEISMAYILTISCINAFAVGGLLAYIETYPSSFGFTIKKVIRYVTLPLIVLLLLQFTYFYFSWFSIRLIVSVITFQAIVLCVNNQKRNVFYLVFTNPFLNFVGMISYGIYLYHCPLPSYWRRFFRVLHIENPFTSDNFTVNYLELSLQFIVLLLVSYLS